MLDDLFKRTEHLVQQSIEYMLNQMLKPFKRVLSLENDPFKSHQKLTNSLVAKR